MKKRTSGTVKANDARRRKRRKFFLAIVIILTAALILTLVVNIIINRNFKVAFYQIRSDKVSDNIRIIELSDLHDREYGKDNAKLVGKIRDLNPDLIVYAGDMMNYGDDDYSSLWNLSEQLSEIAPVYACYGNNELEQQLFKDKKFVEEFEKHGVIFLSNEAVDLKIKKSALQIIAVSEDLNQYDVETNTSKKFVDSLEPTDRYRICLAHYPLLFREKLQDRGIDLVLSGHAHGGQVRIPFVGGLYAPGEGFLPKLTAGAVTAEDGTTAIISRGLGGTPYLPRINNQPELVVIDVCWY